MKADRLIAAEQFVTLAGYVASDLIGQPQGQRQLPSPKIVVGVLAFFAGLSWVASLGAQPARVASAAGAVVTLVFVMRPLVAGTFERVAAALTGFLSIGAPAPASSSSTVGA